MPSSSTTMQLSIDILAVDAASSVFNSVGKTISGLSGPAGLAVGAITAIGGAAVAMGASSVQAAAQFQSGMTTLVTGAGEAQSNIKMVSDGILALSTSTGASTDQLTSAMYQIESSGQHGAAGLQVLQAAAEGAKVGNADLGTTAGALTTILTDYHMTATQSAQAMNGLTATVQSGKTNLQELSSSMGAVLPLASSLGLSFPQVAGGLATMTNAGMSAQHASQNLANTIRSLSAPNSAAAKSMNAVGLSAQQLKNELSTQGLTGAIQLVEDHVGKKFPAGSVEAVQAFKSIMGGAAGYNAALMLGGQNMATYENNVKSITAAMSTGGNTINGWAQIQNTLNVQVQRAQAAFSALQIQLGTVFLPVLTQLTGFVANIISGFVSWEQSTNGLQTAMSSIGSLIQGVLSLISGGFSGLPDLATGWGQNMVTGFANGVISALNSVITAVATIVNEIDAYIGFASPSKKGPGRNLTKWGQNMAKGFGEGMGNGAKYLDDASADLATHIKLPGQDDDGGAKAAGLASVAGNVASPAHAAGLATVAGNATLVSATATTNNALKSVCKTASGVSSCVSTNTAKMASATAKNGAAQASAQAKTAAAAQKHAATVAASAKKHAASTAKHNAAVEAAAKKHQEVLAREAANAQKRKEAAAAAAAKKAAKAAGGSGGTLAAVAPVLPTLPTAAKTAAKAFNVQSLFGGNSAIGQASAAGQKVVTAYANGLKSAQSQLRPILAGIDSFIKSMITAIAPMIKPSLQILMQLFTGSWNAAKTLGSATATTLLPALGNLVSAVAPIVSGFLRWLASSGLIKTVFAALGGIIKIVATTLGALINVLAGIIGFFTKNQIAMDLLLSILGMIALQILSIVIPALIAFGITVLSTMVPAFIAWAAGAAAAAVATLAATWPIVLAGIIVTAVIFGIILAVQHWGAIAKWLQGAWSATVSFFKGVWSGVVKIFSGIGKWFQDRFAEASNGVQRGWQKTQSFFGGVGKWFQDRGKDAANGWQSGMAALKAANQNMVNGVVSGFQWLYDHNYYVKAAMDALASWNKAATAWIVSSWNTATSWLGTQWQKISGYAVVYWNLIYYTVKAWIDKALLWIQQQWTTVSTWIQKQWKIISGYATVYFTLIYYTVKAWIDQAIAWLQSVWTTASTWIQTQWSKLALFAATAWQAVSTVFSQIWSRYIGGPLGSLWTSISTWFSQLGSGALQSGKNFIQMLANGIVAGAGTIWNAVKGIANTIWSALGFHSPPKGGPLHDSDEYMPRMIKMMAGGLNAGVPTMQRAANNVAAAIASAVNPSTLFTESGGGVALPNYATGAGTVVAEPVAATTSSPLANEMHIHVHLGDSDGDANQHARKVADAVKRELAKQLRGQGNAPRLVSGGH